MNWFLLIAAYNAVVFFMYWLDKQRAKQGWRRTPEKTLLWLAALGGGPGACLGIFFVRHKTQKPRFAVGVPVMTAAQAALLLWAYYR